MSIQSDIEMLSVQAMEAYARRHGLTGKDIVDLFHKYQVFEKMIIIEEILEKGFIQLYYNLSQKNGPTGFHSVKKKKSIMYMSIYFQKARC